MLTTIRLLTIPAFVYFMFVDNYILVAVALILAIATDLLDGFVARKFNMITKFGKIYDPFVDKLTRIAVFYAVTIKFHIINIPLMAVVTVREIMLGVFDFLLWRMDISVATSNYSKLVTSIFYASVILCVFLTYANNPAAGTVCLIVALVAAALSLYIYGNFKSFKSNSKLKNNGC